MASKVLIMGHLQMRNNETNKQTEAKKMRVGEKQRSIVRRAGYLWTRIISQPEPI